MRHLKLAPYLLCILLVSLLLTACGSSQDEASSTAGAYDVDVYGDLERVNPHNQLVIFWHQYTQQREAVLLEMIDEFNATNEWGITILAEHAETTAEIYQTIQSQDETMTLPTLIATDPHQAAEYAEQEIIIALTPYLESETWGPSNPEDFLDAALASDQLANFEEPYSFPIGRSMSVLYYNRDWLSDLGYTQPPQTWDAFQEIACAAADPQAGIYGYEFSIDARVFIDMLANHGESMLSETATAYTFEGDAGQETLTLIQNLLDDDCALVETTANGDQADFAAGRVLFTIGSTSNLPYYRDLVAEEAGFDWAIATFPTNLDTPRIGMYSASFSISHTTPRKQLAAWLFLRWMTETEQQAHWASATSYVPVRASALDPMQDADYPQIEQITEFVQHEATTQPGIAGYQTCETAIEDMLAAIATGEDIEIWLANTIDICNDSLPAEN